VVVVTAPPAVLAARPGPKPLTPNSLNPLAAGPRN
jgi:hypothetical protein